MIRKITCLFVLMLLMSGCAAQMHASSGWDFLNKNQPDEAIQEFELSGQTEHLPGYYLGMYDAYLMKKEPEKAIGYLKEGVTTYPDDLFLNHTMGLYYLKVSRPQDYEKAISYFEKCKVLDKSHSITKQKVTRRFI